MSRRKGRKMKKIEIKLKECCLACEHFDPSGCSGLSPSVFYCGDHDRVIACGHMKVCKKYLFAESKKSFWTRIEYRNKDGVCGKVMWACESCGAHVAERTAFCPYCGAGNDVQ